MGYFSNGTEGDIYHERYCQRCVHWPDNPDDGGCSIWLLHLIHNYDECNNPDSWLHVLIRRSEDKIGNDQCTLFLPKGSPSDGRGTVTAWPT